MKTALALAVALAVVVALALFIRALVYAVLRGRLQGSYSLALHCSGSSATFDSFAKACLTGQRVAHQHRRYRRCARASSNPDPVIAANTVGLAAAARGGRSESKRKGGTNRTAQGNLRRAPVPHWAYENGGGDYRHDTNLYVRFRCRSRGRFHRHLPGARKNGGCPHANTVGLFLAFKCEIRMQPRRFNMAYPISQDYALQTFEKAHVPGAG
jgi:hypothetical protein